MDTIIPPEPPDLRLVLPRDAYHHLVRTLHTSLPPPAVDTPEDRACRDRSAIAQIAALLPANAAEATLAAQFVSTDAHMSDCMRLCQDPALTPDLAIKCRAQAASMSRQSQSALRLLARLQAASQKIAADPVAADKAAWAEHCALGLMLQALPGAPPVTLEEPQPPSSPPEPAPQPEHDDEPQPDPIAETEQYAIFYPDRARLIRRTGGVPADVRFGPPPDYITHQLVNGRTPALLALDEPLPAPA